MTRKKRLFFISLIIMIIIGFASIGVANILPEQTGLQKYKDLLNKRSNLFGEKREKRSEITLDASSFKCPAYGIPLTAKEILLSKKGKNMMDILTSKGADFWFVLDKDKNPSGLMILDSNGEGEMRGIEQSKQLYLVYQSFINKISDEDKIYYLDLCGTGAFMVINKDNEEYVWLDAVSANRFGFKPYQKYSGEEILGSLEKYINKFNN